MQGADELPVSSLLLPSGPILQGSHQSCDAAEVADSSAQQATEIGGVEDMNAACCSSQPIITAQSNTTHAAVQKSHMLVQHAQQPQQMQEHGSVQQAQHAQPTYHAQLSQQLQEHGSAQQAQHAPQTFHAQLPQQLQEHGSVQQAQHAQQAQQTQLAQLPQQSQEQQHAQQAQHALKASGLSALFNIGKKRKSRKAIAAAVSQGAEASGKPTQAAILGACPPDTPPHSSGKQRVMHKLKVLAKKMRPSCLQACSTGTKSDEQQQEGVQLQGLSSRIPSSAEDDSRHVQRVAASIHVDSVRGKKQVLSGASGETPGLSRLRGIFRQKKTVARSSKQASSDWARGSGADSEQEPAASSTAGSFIAAVRAVGDVEPQAEVTDKRTVVGGKPADQVSSEACLCVHLPRIRAASHIPPLLRVLPCLLIGPCLPIQRLSLCM